MKRTVEGRRGLLRLGLVCCVIAAVASVFSFEGARMVGAPLPLHFLVFTLLPDAIGFCILLWMLRRLKTGSSGQP
jgi:lipopolysaccharide export LptBFGC system permease protein LptF